MGWRFLLRVIVKAAILFVLANLIFALLDPLETLGRNVSLYNVVLPGRERLPYGENPAESYNLNLYNVPALFAAHEIARAKPADEYRVLLIGDSSTWGWFLTTGRDLRRQPQRGTLDQRRRTPDRRLQPRLPDHVADQRLDAARHRYAVPT